jgi:transposase InsO family protein
MMAKRGVVVDHATVHRWAVKILPVLARMFRRRKRPVGKNLNSSISTSSAVSKNWRSELDDYIRCYNHDRIKLKLRGLSPVDYHKRFVTI